ncbi:hypothetical protein ACLMAJ_00010 [Nocardia sp. KC 131]|uniref:hypothetical protein n=1 Tax=Nocardia arseniciresistens TaxID=3392119 RepID=UPI00398ECFAC
MDFAVCLDQVNEMAAMAVERRERVTEHDRQRTLGREPYRKPDRIGGQLTNALADCGQWT